MILVESAGSTDVGKRRRNNEDSLFLDDDIKLYCVADGIGGHSAGEVASRLVVDTMRDVMKISRFKRQKAECIPAYKDHLSDKAAQMIFSVFRANGVVYNYAQSRATFRGMGSTISAVYIMEDTFITTNVGDSPIYLIREGEIEMIAILHTLLDEYERIIRKGGKIPVKKPSIKYSHVLTRAMGTRKEVRPAVREIEWENGDTLVLCSDGLSDNVKPVEIRDIVLGKSPKEICPILVDLSNHRGGHDNITVIVLTIRRMDVDRSVHGMGIGKIDTRPPMRSHTMVVSEENLKERSPDSGIIHDDESDGISLMSLPTGGGESVSQAILEDDGFGGGLPEDVIVVDVDSEDASYRTYIDDISPYGVTIDIKESFSEGQKLLLTFTMSGCEYTLSIPGEVEKRRPDGIDILFGKLSGKDVEIIKTFQNLL